MSEKKRKFMTYEEFEKTVLNMIFYNMDPEEKLETERDLKDLLDFDPRFIKNEYRSTCAYYNKGQDAFNSVLLHSRAVQNILMSL